MKSNNATLTPQNLLAISKAVTDKEVKVIREQVEPGKYTGTVLVRISYGMNVGEDYESTITASVPWQKICAILFSKVNDATMESVIREALENGVDSAEVDREAKEAVQRLMEPAKRVLPWPCDCYRNRRTRGRVRAVRGY